MIWSSGVSLTAEIISLVTIASFPYAVKYSVKASSSQVFGPSVYSGPGRRRSIALTFDDGPSPGTTDLLDYLRQQGVRATFFQCGANVERYPEIARAVYAGGHEIGNHTFSHRRLCPRLGWRLNLLTRKQVFLEIARTQSMLKRHVGIKPRLFRAPYGMRWFGLREAQRRLNLKGVMWTVIGRDWEWDARSVADLILRRARPGGIVCLHDGRDTLARPNIDVTLEAVKLIVSGLKERNYAFETVSELLH